MQQSFWRVLKGSPTRSSRVSCSQSKTIRSNEKASSPEVEDAQLYYERLRQQSQQFAALLREVPLGGHTNAFALPGFGGLAQPHLNFVVGGDGWAANAGLGLISHGQPQKKRKLPCESSAKGLTGKAEDNTKDSKATAQCGGSKKAKGTTAGGKKKRARRKTKWNVEPGLSVVRKAIYLYRNGVCNSVQIERLLQVPARTLRRYVNESMDDTCKLFYMPETAHERRGRELQEAGQRHGLYSHKSLEAAVRYARPRPTTSVEEAVDAAAQAFPAGGSSTSTSSTGSPSSKVEAAPAQAEARIVKDHSLTAPVPVVAAEQRVPKAHSLMDPAQSLSRGPSLTAGDGQVFDLDGTLDVLEGLGGGLVAPAVKAAQSDQRQGALQDLDFSMLDYFSGLESAGGASASTLHSMLSPTDAATATATPGTQRLRDRNLSIGSIFDQIEELPVPALSSDDACVASDPVAEAAHEARWAEQKRQLVQPSLW